MCLLIYQVLINIFCIVVLKPIYWNQWWNPNIQKIIYKEREDWKVDKPKGKIYILLIKQANHINSYKEKCHLNHQLSNLVEINHKLFGKPKKYLTFVNKLF